MKKGILRIWIDEHRKIVRIISLPLIILLLIAVTILYNRTGGVKLGYSHAMYIPVLLAGFVFGWRGGVLVGLIAGFMLGQFMPHVFLGGEANNGGNWLFRLSVFTLIGFLAGLASDITRAYQQKLRWLLQHNNTTRLPNRRALIKNLNQYEAAPVLDPDNSFVLVVVCCENEIELKSAFGSEVIETVVLQLAKRFSELSPDALSYHTDGAQISVFFRVENAQIAHLIDELLESANEPVLYNDVKIHIDTRIGYHCFAQNEDSQKNLSLAEAALTMAKQTSREIVAYSSEITTTTEENIQLLGELKHALKNGQLRLHYQPKVDMATGRIYGAEALLRWEHPTQGNIPPCNFIPRAEQSTLIDVVTEFVLQQAIQQLAIWQKAGINICISVNISTRNLLQVGFTETIALLLNKYKLNGQLLELEITEGSLMLDMKRSIDELARLKALGILISIDDFGTGYSSLQYLHQLPISVLKIDQSFVRRLFIDQGANYILEAAIMLAHKMGLAAIAEGVETQESYDFLQLLGCDKAQGYLISKPISAPDFKTWYLANQGVYQPGTKLS